MTYSTQMKACLPSGQGLSLKNAAGARLASISGRIWLTMEGDSRYIELPAGGAHTIEHNAPAFVKATEQSLVQLSFPRTRLPAWKRLPRWLEAWFVSIGEARMRARMNQGLWD